MAKASMRVSISDSSKALVSPFSESFVGFTLAEAGWTDVRRWGQRIPPWKICANEIAPWPRISSAMRARPGNWWSPHTPISPSHPCPSGTTCVAAVVMIPKPPSARLTSQLISSSERVPSAWLCLLVIAARTLRLRTTCPVRGNVNGSLGLLIEISSLSFD